MMFERITRSISSLNRCSRGTSVTELALVSPLLAILFMGMVDGASAIAAKLQLEQAGQRAIERATAYGTAGSDYSDIDDEAATAAGVPVENVTFDNWLECDGTRQASFEDICENDEQIARYVSIDIVSSFEPAFFYGPVGTWIGVRDNGSIPITVDSSVRIQ